MKQATWSRGLAALTVLVVLGVPGCAEPDAVVEPEVSADDGGKDSTIYLDAHAHIGSCSLLTAGSAGEPNPSAVCNADPSEDCSGLAPGLVTTAQEYLEQYVDNVGSGGSGAQKTQLLSMAYGWSSPQLLGSDESAYTEQEYANVQCENDYVAEQASLYPGQLYAFCSVNPKKDNAIEEITRCATELGTAGLKLHFSNSQVDMTDPATAAQVADVLTVAQENHLPVVIHFGDLELLCCQPCEDCEFEDENCCQPSGTCCTEPNEAGMEDAMAVMLNTTLPAVPTPLHLQFAHLTGVGSFPDWTSSTLSMLTEAYINGGVPALQGHELYVDVAAIFNPNSVSICDDSGVADESETTTCTIPGVTDYLENLGSVLQQWPMNRLFWGSDYQTDGFTNTVEDWPPPLTDYDFNTMAAATGDDFRDAP